MSKFFKIVSGRIVASDPLYFKGEWCQGIIPAKNGDWQVHIQTLPNGRIASIAAWNIEAAIENIYLPNNIYSAGELPFVFNVDSGQFGYFDHDSYRNDNIGDIPQVDWGEKKNEGDAFYSACTYATLETPDKYSVFPFGIVSRSGYGDFQTKGIIDKDGNYIALSTIFIEDRTDDYDEAEEDDIEDENL